MSIKIVLHFGCATYEVEQKWTFNIYNSVPGVGGASHNGIVGLLPVLIILSKLETKPLAAAVAVSHQ